MPSTKTEQPEAVPLLSYSRFLMKCGHAASGWQTAPGEKISLPAKPVCFYCRDHGIPGATEVESEVTSLEGRQARCTCMKVEPSSYHLPFFMIRQGFKRKHGRTPKDTEVFEYDEFYCGHFGWD